MKVAMYLMVAAFFVLVGGLYAGIGWVTAWLLEIGLNLDVNYSVFVWAGIGIYAICLIPLMLFAGLTKMIDEKHKKDFTFNK